MSSKYVNLKINKELYDKFQSVGGNDDTLKKMIDQWVYDNEVAVVDDQAIRDFRNAYEELGKGRGFVRIHRVRDLLNWSEKKFKVVMEHLVSNLVVELTGGDPSSMTKEELEKSWPDKRTGFLCITMTWWKRNVGI